MLEAILLNFFIQISFITTLVSIFRYSKYFNTKLKYFPVLLMYVFLTELLGLIIKVDPDRNPFFTDFYSNYNFLIYNIYDLLFYGYFYYLFWHYCFLKRNKNIILIGAILFLISFIVNASIINIISKPQLYSYTIGGLVLITATIVYLKEDFAKKKYNKNLLFWISIGLLIFHIGFIPINIMYTYTTIETKTLNYVLPKVHLALVFIMYASFIYGFIKMKGKLKIL